MGNKIKGGIRARGTSEFKDIKTARLEVSADVLDQVISNKGFKSLHEKFNLRAPQSSQDVDIEIKYCMESTDDLTQFTCELSSYLGRLDNDGKEQESILKQQNMLKICTKQQKQRTIGQVQSKAKEEYFKCINITMANGDYNNRKATSQCDAEQLQSERVNDFEQERDIVSNEGRRISTNNDQPNIKKRDQKFKNKYKNKEQQIKEQIDDLFNDNFSQNEKPPRRNKRRGKSWWQLGKRKGNRELSVDDYLEGYKKRQQMLDVKLDEATENRDKNRIIFMKRVLKSYAQRIINNKTRAKETEYYDRKLAELNKRRDAQQIEIKQLQQIVKDTCLYCKKKKKTLLQQSNRHIGDQITSRVHF